MQRVESALSGQSSLGIMLVRLFTGILLFAHGYQKVFNTGLGAVAGFFEKIGIVLPQVTGPFIGLLELIGGALLFLGLFTRWLGAIFAVEFLYATYAKWVLMDKGYFGSETEIYILVTGLLLASNGGGRYSLD
ncbi:MAG: DoxX family protein, partial [SAR324 cluster bacterium]